MGRFSAKENKKLGSVISTGNNNIFILAPKSLITNQKDAVLSPFKKTNWKMTGSGGNRAHLIGQ